MENIGLVLEGGGMRGVYTAGALDYFMDNNLYFPYVIGVSAGACNGTSYISKQIGRNKIVNIDYIRNPKYLSYRNLIRHGSIFGMDFVFNEIPTKLTPFDFDTFFNSPSKFIIGTTDCKSGKPVYFEKSECKNNILEVVKASSSLPFLSPIVKINEKYLLDGGISDPIPIRKSIGDGNTKNVIILTRNKGYRKTPFKHVRLARRIYSKYEGLIEALINRYRIYNETLDYIEKLESEGKAIVLRPVKPLEVGRIEKNTNKLMELFKQGYNDARNNFEINKWMKK